MTALESLKGDSSISHLITGLLRMKWSERIPDFRNEAVMKMITIGTSFGKSVQEPPEREDSKTLKKGRRAQGCTESMKQRLMEGKCILSSIKTTGVPTPQRRKRGFTH